MPNDPTGIEWRTPVLIKDTSATERAKFRRCRRDWFLSTVHRLGSVEGNDNFWLGTLVHAGLERYYKTLKDNSWRSTMPLDRQLVIHEHATEEALAWYQEVYNAEILKIEKQLGYIWTMVQQKWEDLGQLGWEMIAGYLEREITDPVFEEVVDVERRVFVAIRSPAGRKVGTLAVMADLVGRRQGRLGVCDHKTASREMSASQLDLDDQLTAECYAGYIHYGEFPEEAVYNVLLKKVARPPKRLKDKLIPKKLGGGTTPALSKDKDQPTTHKLYVEALDELGLDHADYQEFLDFLREREATGEPMFFRRDRVLRSEAQLASFEANLYEEYRDMKAVAAHPERAYPNPSPFNCPSCPVKLICLTIQDDGDVSAIIQANYIVGDPRR